MALRTLESLGSLAGTRVIVRCDLNVPLKDGVITDDGRVRAALPTLTALVGQGARVIAVSHLGRPDGAPDAKYSLAPVAERLAELLEAPVVDSVDRLSDDRVDVVAAVPPQDVVADVAGVRPDGESGDPAAAPERVGDRR